MENQHQIDNVEMLPVGYTLNGKYTITRQLSSRGFGNIYVASNTKFRDNVLIRELFVKNVCIRDTDHTTVVVDERFRTIFSEYADKFAEEARSIRQIHNDHMLNVTDLFSENNTNYYVMEYVEGETLSEKMLRKKEVLGESEAISYLTQIIEGLKAMHRQGFWHLDLSPSNILIDQNGRVKFVEYGHCKLVDNESTIIADKNHDPIELQTTDLNNIGPWTDFYALGATLYNILTGKLPPSAVEINEATTSLYHFPTTVSKKMQRLILWMMTPNIFRRPQDIGEINDFLYGVNSSVLEEEEAKSKKSHSKSGQQTERNNSQKAGSAGYYSHDDEDEDSDGLGNKTLKAMQIFIFLCVVAFIGFWAYRLFFNDDKAKETDKATVNLVKEQKQPTPSVTDTDTATTIDVMSISSDDLTKSDLPSATETSKNEDQGRKDKDNQEKVSPKVEEKAEKEQSSLPNSQDDTKVSTTTSSATPAPSSNSTQQSQNEGIKVPENVKKEAKEKVSESVNESKNIQRYNIVVGSFSTKENADRKTDELRASGYNATTKYSESKNMFRVVVNRADEATKNKLKEKYPDAWNE